MKAQFSNRCTLLTLTPETDDEKLELKMFSEELARTHYIGSRGFRYLDPSVEFLIQPTGSSE